MSEKGPEISQELGTKKSSEVKKRATIATVVAIGAIFVGAAAAIEVDNKLNNRVSIGEVTCDGHVYKTFRPGEPIDEITSQAMNSFNVEQTEETKRNMRSIVTYLIGEANLYPDQDGTQPLVKDLVTVDWPTNCY